ncbi:hypothetical protein [Nonomuraea soli]|uniref:Uncharacterized protein n=1 Tax=Nonomuraea soli TaxID=1032476 RepID=A0A7W0HVZ6_9ACTN|nr:hypothetical protein [Nonomuraea soli]MBA2897729.1 hypothetical protein [Nonomuraea soli]
MAFALVDGQDGGPGEVVAVAEHVDGVAPGARRLRALAVDLGQRGGLLQQMLGSDLLGGDAGRQDDVLMVGDDRAAFGVVDREADRAGVGLGAGQVGRTEHAGQQGGDFPAGQVRVDGDAVAARGLLAQVLQDAVRHGIAQPGPAGRRLPRGPQPFRGDALPKPLLERGPQVRPRQLKLGGQLQCQAEFGLRPLPLSLAGLLGAPVDRDSGAVQGGVDGAA